MTQPTTPCSYLHSRLPAHSDGTYGPILTVDQVPTREIVGINPRNPMDYDVTPTPGSDKIEICQTTTYCGRLSRVHGSVILPLYRMIPYEQ